MMRLLFPLCVLLPGLLLTACGGVVDSPDAMEPTGTTELAMCSSSAVTSLTISGISTYQGEMAGSGSWAVSYPANAVRLEFRVDNVLQSSSELSGTSGSWYFSKTGLSCGTHLFNVKAWPMVVDSGGGRTTCWGNTTKTASQYVTEPCPTYCGDFECSPGEDEFNCSMDCCQGRCANGACCSAMNTCSDYSYCTLY